MAEQNFKKSEIKKLIIFGAGSGLGLEVLKSLQTTKDFFSEVFVVSRKNTLQLSDSDFYRADFSKSEEWPAAMNYMLDKSPTHIWYFAGGGPYGLFHEKKWNSHEWAFAVNFLFPAYLSHFVLRDHLKDSTALPHLEQMIFTGSKIAENQPDLGATSYSASKHALRGLVFNLINEYNSLDIRLFSPDYMATALLPANSKPVVSGQALNAANVAIQFIDWARQKGPKHLTF